MTWVLGFPGLLGVGSPGDLGLSHAEKGLMVATPVLAGALLRSSWASGRRLSPEDGGDHRPDHRLCGWPYAWVAGVSYGTGADPRPLPRCRRRIFAVAFAAGLRWYPPEHQGTAMGIAGAGNSGTALAALFALAWLPPLAGPSSASCADSAGHRSVSPYLFWPGRAGGPPSPKSSPNT